jgi:hypothetical protein
MYRVDPATFLGKTIHDFHPTPEQADHFAALDRRVVATGKSLRDEEYYTHLDGSAGVGLGYRFPIGLPNGGIGVGGVFVEITELHNARAKAKQPKPATAKSSTTSASRSPSTAPTATSSTPTLPALS